MQAVSICRNRQTKIPCFSIVEAQTAGTNALRILNLLARQMSVINLSPTIHTLEQSRSPIILRTQRSLQGFLLTVLKILIPYTSLGSPCLMLLERMYSLIFISFNDFMDAFICSSWIENQWRWVSVSSLSNIISFVCVILASMTICGKEDSISVGLNFCGDFRRSIASLIIQMRLQFVKYHYQNLEKSPE